MLTTPNYGLKKPEGTDVVNIDDLNYNADIIDTEMAKRALKSEIPKVPVTSVNNKTGAVSISKSDIGLGNVTNDAQVKRAEMGVASGVATLDANGVNAQAPKSHTHNYAGSSSAGGSANSAVKLATGRGLTIGNTKKTFDGSADVTWTLAEIGASASNHTHDDRYYTETEINNKLADKQNKSDSTLTTTSKTIVGAINELNEKSKSTIDGTKYRRYKNSNITSLTSVINISGSGYLKTALILAEGYTTNEQLKITIDNKLIFGTNEVKLYPVGSKKYAALGLCKNLFGSFMDGSTAYFSADGVEGFIMDKSFNKNLNFPSTTLQSLSDSYGCVYPVGELIRFESSLKIEVKTSKDVLVEYYLD